jgi:hypothetical protein
MEESIIIFFGFIIGAFQLLFYGAVFYLFFKLCTHSIKRDNNHNFFKNNVVNKYDFEERKRRNIYEDVSYEQLQKFNTDNLHGFKDMFYKIFEEFEYAYNDLDYDRMKRLSTPQMYNNYSTGMKLYLEVGKKRIIKDIKRNKIIVYELDSTVAKQSASVLITIDYINYTINKAGLVISGNRYQSTRETFEVTFRKDFRKEEIVKCPNCGAQITGDKCEYCRTVIPPVEWRIHNIKRILNNKKDEQ